MRTKIFVVMCCYFSLPAAWACVPTPESISLSGATFTEFLDLSLVSGENLALTLTSKAEEKASQDNYDKFKKEFEAWKAQNYLKTYTSYNSYEIENKKKEELRKLYPDIQKTVRHSLVVKDGKACIRNIGSYECTEGSVIIKEAGKPVALLKAQNGQGFIFSVNRQGEQDMRKPYLKIVPNETEERIDIEAHEKEATIGVMRVARPKESDGASVRGIAKSIGDFSGGAESGNLELRGKEYRSAGAGSGCGGQPFEVTNMPTQTKERNSKPAGRSQ